MAFIQGQDEEEQQGLGGGAPLVGGNSQATGQGVSQAGVGSGGSGWTNIQAYLKANEGNTQSANALNKDVGSAFDQEQGALESKASETRAAADANNKAPSLDDAMSGGGAADAMRQYLGGSYSGPKTFDYAMGGKTQSYGDALGTNDGFQGLMQGLYDRSAGGAMTTGQRSLQQQLDVNNPLLAQSQGQLSDRYGQLKSLATQTAGDVGGYLQGAGARHQQGQQDMRGTIGTRADAAKAEADALEAQRGTWNEAKLGSLDDKIAPYRTQYNTLQSFLGGGAANPADGPKSDAQIDGGNSTGGDGMANMGETVDPWATDWTTVTKKKNPLSQIADGAAGWVAPATQWG